jgi:hypothetical protein
MFHIFGSGVLGVQRHRRFDIETAVISNEKIRRGVAEIDSELVLLENRKNVKFPKARIERPLKFIDELTVTILKSPCPACPSRASG